MTVGVPSTVRACRTAGAILAAVATTVGVVAQPSMPIDERQFRAAADLERAGQLAQARDLYRQLVDSTPESARADDALLALARIAWPVGTTGELSAAAVDPGLESHAAAALAARSSLEVLRRSYPGGDTAAEGLWRLALTYLMPSPSTWQPEEAAALLTTLPVLYRDAGRVPGALALAVRLHADAGRRAQARSLAFQLLADWPDDEAVAAAWVTLGRVDYADGDVTSALRSFGRASQTARGAFRPLAEEAIDLATLVDRLTFGPGRGGPLFVQMPGGVRLPGRASRIETAPDGRVLASMPREQAIFFADAAGSSSERRPFAGLSAASVDRWGRLWTAGESRVVAPGSVPLAVADRAEIVSIAPVTPGGAWVVDERERVVMRIESGVGTVATARLPERSVPLRAVPAEQGTAWILTERPASLVKVAADGSRLVRIDLSQAVREPLDVARDPLGHVYVLDGRPASVIVLRPTGELVHRFNVPAGEQGVERARSIAVDRSGAIAVYDDRSERVVWFR